MSAAQSFAIRPGITDFRMKVSLLILGGCWLAILSLAFDGHSYALGVRLWIALGCAFLVVEGWSESRAIASGAWVLGRMQAPRLLWREWLRNALAGGALTLALLVFGGTALLVLPESPWHPLTAAACFSTVFCLASIAGLSNFGALPQFFTWAISLCPVAIAFYGLTQTFDWVAQSPWALQLSIAMSWPLLAGAMAVAWRRNPPHARMPALMRRNGVLARVTGYMRRFTVVGAFADPRRKLSILGRPGKTVGTALVTNCIPVYCLYVFSRDDWWGGAIGPYHFIILAFIALIFCGNLVCKDLHWRQLLAPGGLRAGRFGWQLLGSTMALQWACYSVVAIVWVVVSGAVFNVALERNLEVAWEYRVIPVEFLFATCLGAVVRALGRPMVTYSIVFSSLLVIGAVALWNYGLTGEPKWFSVDTGYVGVLFAASVVLIFISNGLWTAKKLLPYAQIG